jgi:hypothetical protein
MNVPRPSRRELALLLGVPAAWGVLLLFHPRGDAGAFYPVIEDNVTAWLAVHIGMAAFVPLFAICVYLLLRGVESTAATVARAGLLVFAIFYAAWETLLGGGTGILADKVAALPAAEHARGVELVESFAESGLLATLSMIGSVGLAVAIIAAVVALRRAYGLGVAPMVLMLLAMPLIAIHEPPFGPVGLAMFIAAVVLFVRQHAPVKKPATAREPSPRAA